MKRSKKYREVEKLIDKSREYTLDEALGLLPKVSISSFDSSIEIHIKLRLKDKQKKLSIKGSARLPHQIGKTAKIAVITTPEHEDKAKSADIVGGEELIKKIQDGWIDFDVLIATPEIMPKIAVLGKVLGPKGKMPNPKNGTVTTNVSKAIESYKKGKTDFKADKQGGIHRKIATLKMDTKKIKENIVTFLEAVFQEVKNLNTVPFKSVTLAPSMGPGIKLDVNELIKDLT